jgi:REP element-mobilizing transposase RayT
VKRARSCPPYNPALRDLVEGKRAWSIPLSQEE